MDNKGTLQFKWILNAGKFIGLTALGIVMGKLLGNTLAGFYIGMAVGFLELAFTMIKTGKHI